MTEWHGIGHMAGMWWWWILGLVVIVLAIWVVSRARPRQGGAAGESAEERLKRRYADGEIDKTEYETRLKDLRR